MGVTSLPVAGGDGRGRVAASFGTLLNLIIPPRKSTITRLMQVIATAGTTAHTLTILRSLGRTTCVSVNAAGQAVVNITADPGAAISNAIAANDLVAIRESDGVTRLYKVSSVATLAITLTANLVTGTLGGEDFWDFGIITDTDPVTGAAHQILNVPASATTTWADNTDSNVGIARSNGNDEPLLLQDNNATATGTLEQSNWLHTLR